MLLWVGYFFCFLASGTWSKTNVPVKTWIFNVTVLSFICNFASFFRKSLPIHRCPQAVFVGSLLYRALFLYPCAFVSILVSDFCWDNVYSGMTHLQCISSAQYFVATYSVIYRSIPSSSSANSQEKAHKLILVMRIPFRPLKICCFWSLWHMCKIFFTNFLYSLNSIVL